MYSSRLWQWQGRQVARPDLLQPALLIQSLPGLIQLDCLGLSNTLSTNAKIDRVLIHHQQLLVLVVLHLTALLPVIEGGLVFQHRIDPATFQQSQFVFMAADFHQSRAKAVLLNQLVESLAVVSAI